MPDNPGTHQILSIDYQNFVNKVGTVATGLDLILSSIIVSGTTTPLVSISSLVASATEVLSAEEVNLKRLYPILDSMISFFDPTLVFFGLSLTDVDAVFNFTEFISDLVKKKFTILRVALQEKGDPTDQLFHVYGILQQATDCVISFLEFLDSYRARLWNGSTWTFTENNLANRKKNELSVVLHTVMKLLVVLDQQENSENAVAPKKKTTPFDLYPFMSSCRIADKGLLEDMIRKYGEDVKKIHRKPVLFNPDHDRVLLFHKESSIWNHKRQTEKQPRATLSFAYVVYLDENQYVFLVHPKPPDCFLIVMDQEDFEDLQKTPYKTIFLQNAVRITRCMYGMFGVSA